MTRLTPKLVIIYEIMMVRMIMNIFIEHLLYTRDT